MGSKTSKTGRLRRKGTLAAIIAVVIVAALSIGAYAFLTDGRTVASGDMVRVDYIGKLPNGQVFDTSLYAVAVDNATYPKSLFFNFRGDESTYGTLNFTVGKGGMIPGFEKGVLGMKVGETKTLVIPVEQAYGQANESKITAMNLTETIPANKQMSVDEFRSYFGVAPSQFTLYTDPNYGWTVYTGLVDSSKVMVQNQPVNGSVYHAFGSPSDPSYGWNVTAEYDASGENIVLRHHLNASSAMSVKGIDEARTKFYVKSVDETAGTAIIDRNNQILGVELTFIVTLISIG